MRAGGCHCGAVRFEVTAEPERGLVCDCSICAKKGFVHWIVRADEFRLLTSWDALRTYTFNTRTARHLFCGTCGISSFYVPRSHPDGFSVNLRCVEEIDLHEIELVPFQGRDWERARTALDDTPVYLDHNATTPIAKAALEAMLPYLSTHFGNPSSGHALGRHAKDAIEAARARVAALIGASADEIVFTSGGTEANNLAIAGATGHAISSTIEHPATRRPLEALGVPIDWIPVGPAGSVDPDAVIAAIRPETSLITLMHSNNETGVIQPIAEIGRRRGRVRFHTDAAQSVGKVPIDVAALGVDLLSIAGHKLYGPKGVGALYVRRGVSIAPVLRGAGQERGLRPGTENVASIVGLGAACALAGSRLEALARIAALRDRLFDRLPPGSVQNGDGERLPNTLSVRLPGVSGSRVLEACPEVLASTGSACHSGEEHASAVLLAMGVDPTAALGTLRLTLGHGTSQADVDRAAKAIGRAWTKVRAGVS